MLAVCYQIKFSRNSSAEKLETMKSKLDKKAHNLKLPDVSPASDKLKISVRRGSLNRLTPPE